MDGLVEGLDLVGEPVGGLLVGRSSPTQAGTRAVA